MSFTSPCESVFLKDALRNKCILVTGSSSGIGADAAKLFSSLGARVVLIGRDSRKLDLAIENIPTDLCCKKIVDLSLPDSIYYEIKKLPSEWLPLHGVFHAAGFELVKPIRLCKSMILIC